MRIGVLALQGAVEPHRAKLQNKPLVVAGCLPKAEKGTVEKFSKNASLLGPNSLGRTLDVINATLKGEKKIALSDSDLSNEAIAASLEYIHNNPAKRGLCREAVDWKWSSARHYAGWQTDEDLPNIHALPDGSLA